MNISLRRLVAPICLGLICVFVALGCGGGGSSPGPTPTALPTPIPTLPNNGTPIPPPATPFDVRGRVLVGGVAQSGIVVTATGDANSVTAADRTTSGDGGTYSFFLGAGTYTLTATTGNRSATRVVTVPFGGQTVDNFDLNL